MISDDRRGRLGAERGAHWLRAGVIAWDLPDDRDGLSYRLHWAPEGGLAVEDGAIAGGASFPLDARRRAGCRRDVRAQYPHLAAYEALRVPAAARRRARELLTGQLVVAAYDAAGAARAAPPACRSPACSTTSTPAPPTRGSARPGAAAGPRSPCGRRPPSSVGLLISLGAARAARRDAPRRRRRVAREGPRGWRNARLRASRCTVYVPTLDEVVTNVVTDPYSLALTTNSQRSVLVDLDDPALAPRGLGPARKPALAQPEDSTIYELHVRDFSITDETVPAAHRGTYLAFTDADSDGMRHLRELARAGLNTLHLLPANDIATIEEDRAAQAGAGVRPAVVPARLARSSRRASSRSRDADGFNWGYDPLHYTTPEGSYATEPGRAGAHARVPRDGPGHQRRRPARGHGRRLQPHAGRRPGPEVDPRPRSCPATTSGSTPTTGAVETSTCCANTATEHRMMEKLMVDSVRHLGARSTRSTASAST